MCCRQISKAYYVDCVTDVLSPDVEDSNDSRKTLDEGG